MSIPTADWIELHDLVTRYSRALDTRDYDLLRTVFTKDAHISYDFTSKGVELDALTYHSADAFAIDAENIHAPLLATMHRNTNHWFEVDGDQATGRVYVDLFEVRIDGDAPETVHHLGWYNDVYTRVDGSWVMAERHFVFKWAEGEWIGARPVAEN